MKNRLLAALTTVAAILLASPAFAQGIEQVKAELRKKYPDAPIDSVRKVPYSNLFEVVGSGEIFYTDDKATFLLVGSLIDTKSKENITETRMRQVNAIRFDQLPLEAAIKIVRGKGTRKIAVFEDPNCGYCKRFERDLATIDDITVYMFLYPILSPASVDLSKAIWCAPDKQKAWLDYMLKDVAPPPVAKGCEPPTDKSLNFGRDKRITGTPTIIFEDGERIPGAIPAAQLEKRLVEAKAALANAAPAK